MTHKIVCLPTILTLGVLVGTLSLPAYASNLTFKEASVLAGADADSHEGDQSANTGQDTHRKSPSSSTRPNAIGAIVEITGAYGLQFGTTPYIPQGNGTSFDHPLTNGFAFGATAGYRVFPGIYAVANYEFTSASSVDGEILGAVDKIEGKIRYHTIVAGLRSVRPIGPGRLLGELGIGVVLPFETELEYTYNQALAPAGIEGIGTTTNEYNLGIGAQGVLGYQIDIASYFYAAALLKVNSFTTSNNGKSRKLDNFVADFTAQIPSAVTAETEFDSDGVQPSTFSVQALRFQLAIGAYF